MSNHASYEVETNYNQKPPELIWGHEPADGSGTKFRMFVIYPEGSSGRIIIEQSRENDAFGSPRWENFEWKLPLSLMEEFARGFSGNDDILLNVVKKR